MENRHVFGSSKERFSRTCWRLRFRGALVRSWRLCVGDIGCHAGWMAPRRGAGRRGRAFDIRWRRPDADRRWPVSAVDPIEQCPPELWPIVVPAGAVGNRCRMRALPGTRFLVESDLAEQITGDPFCVIPAASLIDAGIATQEPPTSFVEIMTLTFDSEQLVYSDGGALIMSGSAMPGEPLDVDGLLQDPVGRAYSKLDTETEAQIARDAIDLSRIGLTAA